jgi:hypothetical protein
MERPTSPTGYSGRPLPQKLGIKEGFTVALAGPPEGFATLLTPLPDRVQLLPGMPACDLLLWFLRSRQELEDGIAALAARRDVGAVWMVWVKKAANPKTDLGENEIREIVLPHGLVDYKVCAVDATWSGLKLAWRKMAET